MTRSFLHRNLKNVVNMVALPSQASFSLRGCTQPGIPSNYVPNAAEQLEIDRACRILLPMAMVMSVGTGSITFRLCKKRKPKKLRLLSPGLTESRSRCSGTACACSKIPSGACSA